MITSFFNRPTRLPFNWKTPFGYLATLCFEFIALYFAISTVVPVVCLAIGLNWWIYLLIDEIQINVKFLNKLNRRPKSATNRTELKNRFIAIVIDFGNVKWYDYYIYQAIFLKYDDSLHFAGWSANLLKRSNLISPSLSYGRLRQSLVLCSDYKS